MLRQKLQQPTFSILTKASQLQKIINNPAFNWSKIQNQPLYHEIKQDLLSLQSFYDRDTAEDFYNFFRSDDDPTLTEFKKSNNMHDISMFALHFLQDSYYPAHDHPNMLVFTTVLEGKISIDYFRSTEKPCADLNLIQFKLDFIGQEVLVTGEQTEVCGNNKNIHQLEFYEDTVFLDLVINNYNNTDRTYGIYELEDYKNRLFRRGNISFLAYLNINTHLTTNTAIDVIKV